MKFLRNKNAPPTAGLVQEFIDTAYDNVKLVADNINDVILLANAIEDGDFDALLKSTDIDTLAKLNVIVADANLVDGDTLGTAAYAAIADFATAAEGVLAANSMQLPIASQGEAEAGIDNERPMTPLRVSQAIATFAPQLQNNYDAAVDPVVTDDSDAGYSAGSIWINTTASPNESFRCADATVGAAVWLKTTLTADELATVALTGDSDDLTEGATKLLMTQAERTSLSTMEDNAKDDQTGAEIKGLYETELNTNAFTDAEKTSLGTMEDGATADQSDAEITNAYNNEVAVVTQVDAEAGTDPTVKRWTAQRVAQAIAALASGGTVGEAPIDGSPYSRQDAAWIAAAAGGGGGGMTALYKSIAYTLVSDDLVYSEDGLTHTLPATPSTGDKCSIWDASDNAGSNAITVLRNGSTIFNAAEDFSLNMNGGRVDFMYTGTTWIYSYVIQTLAKVNASSVTRDVTGTTDTLLLEDNGKEIIYSNAASIVVTLPDGFPENWNCVISQAGAGVPTITPVTDTINGAGTGVAPAAQWKGMYLNKYAATAYMAKL